MYYSIRFSALVVLAVVVWSWAASCVHSVKVTVNLMFRRPVSSPSSGMMWGETSDSHIESFFTYALMMANKWLQ